MRKIYQKELSSPIPVIVYVAPDGARAGSAGLWISEAADVLAMAPQTNIGASTPINAGGGDLDKDLRKKVVNDAAASVVALAESHGRGTTLPERALRQAASIPAPDALKQHVIDVIAPTLPALLQKLDGFKTKPRGYVLHLGGAKIDDVKPGFLTRLLNTLIDPNILSLLFLAGIAGIGYEIFHPGIVLPGALGGVALLTALFGFSVLPISWAGLALILLGVVLLVIDAHVTTHGALTVSGLISLVVGMLLLFHNLPAPYHTSLPLVLSFTIALGAFWAFALTKAVQVRRRPVSVGPLRVVGSDAIVRSPGQVFVEGELWRARRTDGRDLVPGEHVQVESVDGLELTVR